MSLRTISSATALALDQHLLSTGSFSLDQLIELAGLSIAQCMTLLSPPSKSPHILIACGPGNNGGDGLVAARHLHHFGYRPIVFYPKPGSKEVYGRLRAQLDFLGVPFTDDFEVELGRCDWVVDAIFGFSFSGPVRDPFGSVIALLAETTKPVLAVDVPSSWHVDLGPPADGLGAAYSPDVVVSLTAPKECMRAFKGRQFVGGRFVGQQVADMFGFDVPPFKGCDQVVEVVAVGERL
ncbi:NAD(P)H-hydrate [Acrodontium crateriforme]|uniref:NAD(P)H-hydrate epimerase n=1 Tax=Acrodontium crateriforme TaxID=150365 RepID=A0AAQ3R6U9_9PEZI|nr:NAD(P)H-hydrate [Acrodontium crateriforme]